MEYKIIARIFENMLFQQKILTHVSLYVDIHLVKIKFHHEEC